MIVGAVILNYNTWSMVGQLAKTLEKMDTIHKIVIVDNASTETDDYTEKIVNSDKVKIIFSEKNGGYAIGNNVGIRYLSTFKDCKYVFILNPDIIISEECFIHMVAAFEKNPGYAVLGAVRKDMAGEYTQRQFWFRPTYWSELKECFAIGRYLKKKRQTYRIQENLTGILTVEVTPGSFFGARMDVLLKMGGLDDNTFLYYEENILSCKVLELGYKQGIVLDAFYIHNHCDVKTYRTLIVSHDRMQKSRKYLHKEYLCISGIKKLLLSFCMKIQDLEMLCYFWWKTKN